MLIRWGLYDRYERWTPEPWWRSKTLVLKKITAKRRKQFWWRVCIKNEGIGNVKFDLLVLENAVDITNVFENVLNLRTHTYVCCSALQLAP